MERVPRKIPTFGRKGCFWAGLLAWLLITAGIAVFAPLLRNQAMLGRGIPAATALAANPNDFYNRVYLRETVGEVVPLPAADAQTAAGIAGFPVLMPAGLPPGFAAPQKIGMNSAHGYRIAIDLEAARQMLTLAGLPTAGLPEGLQRIDTLATVQPVAGLHSQAGAGWFTLLEGRAPLPGLPERIDPAVFDLLGALGLRYMGLPEAQAAALVKRLGWTWFLAFPPGELLRAETTAVRGGEGLLLRSSRPGATDAALIWENAGVIYAVYGNLPPETLVWMVESLR